MTREEILDYFKDINFMYNNPSMFDTLKRMLDELTEPCGDRMKYVQETVNTMLNACTTNSIKDKVFRNAARFVQNAIDGKAPDFEKIDEPEPCEDAVSRADTLQSFESYCEKNCQYSKKQRDVMCGACMMGDAIEIVEELPSVQPERVKGEADALKDVRAEIMAIGHWRTKGELPNGYLVQVIDIIDKYKAESERV